MEQEFDFLKDGILIKRNFLASNQLTSINSELDYLYSKPQKNGCKGFRQFDPFVKTIPFPVVSIKSVNLLEVALDIKNILNAYHPDLKLQLVNVELFEEQRNPKRLFWHSDQRKGMFRAQIYLKGGQEDSGAFEYVQKSHALVGYDYANIHKVSPENLEKYKSDIISARGSSDSSGDMVAFNSLGFHAKMECHNVRRTVMFEFQDKLSTHAKNSVFFSPNYLTPKILSDFEFLIVKSTEFSHPHGPDCYFNSNEGIKDSLLKHYRVLRQKVIHLIFRKILKTS